MNDKKINAWLRRRFSAIGWLLLAYYGLVDLLVSLTAAVDSTRQSLEAFVAGDIRGYLDWNAIYSNGWGYVAAVLVAFAILDAWKGREFWKERVFEKNASMKLRVFAGFLVLCMGAQMVNSWWITLLEMLMNACGKTLLPVLESISGESSSFSMFLYACILAPVWEELLFRGFVLRSLRPYGKRFAIFGSAVLFGLFHGNLLQLPYAVFMGLLMGYAAAEYSVIWSIALHVFNNLVLAELLTRLTASWSDMAYGMLNMVLFGGSALISLGILIAKRQEIRSYRKGEWMDRRCIKCFFTNSGILALTALMCVSIVSLFTM